MGRRGATAEMPLGKALSQLEEVVYQARADMIYDSGVGMVKGTEYFVIAGGTLPIEAHLGDTAKLYYMIDWASAPTDVKGFITIRGTKLS